MRAAALFSTHPSQAARTARVRGILCAWRQCAVIGTRILHLMHRTIDLAPGHKRANRQTYVAAFFAWKMITWHSRFMVNYDEDREERNTLRSELRQCRQEDVVAKRNLKVAVTQTGQLR